MAGDVQYEIAPAERRQVARRLVFEPSNVPYINWSRIVDERAALNCDMDVRVAADGAITVLLFWRYKIAGADDITAAALRLADVVEREQRGEDPRSEAVVAAEIADAVVDVRAAAEARS